MRTIQLTALALLIVLASSHAFAMPGKGGGCGPLLADTGLINLADFALSEEDARAELQRLEGGESTILNRYDSRAVPAGDVVKQPENPRDWKALFRQGLRSAVSPFTVRGASREGAIRFNGSVRQFASALGEVKAEKRFASLRASLDNMPRLTLTEASEILVQFEGSNQLRAYELLKRRIVTPVEVYRFEAVYYHLQRLSDEVQKTIVENEGFKLKKAAFLAALKASPAVLAMALRDHGSIYPTTNFDVQETLLAVDASGWNLPNDGVLEFLPLLSNKQARIDFLENLVRREAVRDVAALRASLQEIAEGPDYDVKTVGFDTAVQAIRTRRSADMRDKLAAELFRVRAGELNVAQRLQLLGLVASGSLQQEILSSIIDRYVVQASDISIEELISTMMEFNDSPEVFDSTLSAFVQSHLNTLRPEDFQRVKELFKSAANAQQAEAVYRSERERRIATGPTSNVVGGNNDVTSKEFLGHIQQFKGTPQWNSKIWDCYVDCRMKDKYFMEAIRLASASTDVKVVRKIIDDLTGRGKWNVRPDLVAQNVAEYASSDKIHDAVLDAYIDTHLPAGKISDAQADNLRAKFRTRR